MLKHHSSVGTAIANSLRGMAVAGGVMAFAAVSPAYAEDTVAPQSARVSPATRLEEPAGSAELSREYLIKAAILFNFAKFATWPKTAFGYPGAPLRVCVLGDDPFGPALESLDGKRVRGRPLTTAQIDAFDEAPQCHILFVSASEEANLPAIIDYVGKLPILTVADIGRFANTGGIIALKTVDNRSRIEINLGAAEQAGLKLSSKLLRLADTVSTRAAQHPAP